MVLHTQVPFAKSFALSHAMRLDPPVEFEQILSCVSAWTKLRQMFPALRFTSSWAPCTDTARSHPEESFSQSIEMDSEQENLTPEFARQKLCGQAQVALLTAPS